MSQPYDLALLDAEFETLLDMAHAERAARLERIEREAPDLAAVLRRLLALAARAETTTIRQFGGALRVVNEPLQAPAIPGYRVGAAIASGGMATVYSATRDVHGVAQPVAIKVLHAMLLAPLDRERFLNEQRILARLHHPHIASLIEVGAVQDRPYMVLEHIDGEPIDERLRPTTSDLPRILEAIAQAADAVQRAHEHFVIHRDIKPANVLLDRSGGVKLIDFGIAKVLDDADGLRTDPTLTGCVPMTLRYASPEQLMQRPVGVGSDIYQLGLLLYRLATGAWPFDDGTGELQAERVRAGAVPVPPSRRVSDPALRAALRGDLDAIVLRCLRFEPADRYRAAADLRDEIERHRRHEPVLARRHTQGYLLRSFMLRHRLGVTVAAAALLLIVVGVVSALLLAQRARQYAARSARTLDAVTEMFRPANPYAPSPKTTTVAQAVEAASARFLEEDAGDPAFQAGVLLRLADMQESAENFARMRELLERADTLARSGDVDATLASRILVRRMEALFRLGEYDALDALRKSRDRELDGAARLQADHLLASVLTERGKLSEASSALLALTAQMQALDAMTQSQILNSLGIVQGRSRDYAVELATYQRAIPMLDPRDISHLPMLIRLRANAATALGNLHRPEEAAREYRSLLEIVRARLDVTHPMVAKVTANTMVALAGAERFHDAFRVGQALDRDAVLREEPAWRAQFLTIFAAAALYDGHFDLVLPNLAEAGELATATLGKGSPRLAYYAEQIAWTLWEFGERPLALAAARASHRLGEGKRTVADMLLQLGAEAGLPVPDRPDPAFTSRLETECDRKHYQALHTKLVEHAPPPKEVVPTDCYAYERARLEALGWEVRPARRETPQPMRSPLLLQWSAPDDPALSVIGQGIPPALRARLAAVIDGF